MTSITSQNRLLGCLPAADLNQLAPLLEPVDLPRGARLYEAGATLTHVYFPQTAVISLTASMQDGSSAEIAVVGNEGVVGVCAFMGDGPSLSNAVVQRDGSGMKISARAIREASRGSASLMQGLLRYTQVLLVHMAQTSACNKHHSLDQQLCRWLLLHLDRIPGNEMLLTQEDIANMLGVRRESVSAGAVRLQAAGLIRYHRGWLAIVDRGGLEDLCCECYAVVKGAYNRFLKDNAGAAQFSTRTWANPVHAGNLLPQSL
jgi:CRP-like cAMP-binding protein